MTTATLEEARLSATALRGGPEIVDGLAPEWRRLCETSADSLPFTRPEWVGAFFRCNDKARRFHLLTVREGGELKAVLPLMERRMTISRVPVNVLRAPSDFDLWPWDIPVDAPVRQAAARLLWRLVRELDGWDMVELPNIPAGGTGEEFLEAAAEDGFPTRRWEYMQSPVIRLGEWNGEGELSAIAASHSLRKNIRNALNRVERDGGFEILRSGRFDPALLAMLNDLECTGWKGAEGNPVFQREKDRVFWNEVCAAAQEGGYLSTYAMCHSGRVAGVTLCLSYRNILFAVKIGWDQRLKSYSPGHLLVREILRDCLRGGTAEFQMMGMRSAWKDQWTREALPHATCRVFRGGLFGKVAQAVVSREDSRMLGAER